MVKVRVYIAERNDITDKKTLKNKKDYTGSFLMRLRIGGANHVIHQGSSMFMYEIRFL